MIRDLYYKAGYRFVYGMMRRFPIMIPQKGGIPVPIAGDADLYIASGILFLNEYDDAIRACAESAAGRVLTFIDLGANTGYFGLRLADAARIHGAALKGTFVEASHACVVRLRQRLGKFPDFNDTTIVEGLAGKRSGSAQLNMWKDPANGMSSVIRTAPGGTVDVAYIDIEQVAPPGPIDLLKCDIEGSELDVIESYPELLKRTQMAVFELHHNLCDTDRCERLVKEAGLVNKRILRNNGEHETVAVFTR